MISGELLRNALLIYREEANRFFDKEPAIFFLCRMNCRGRRYNTSDKHPGIYPVQEDAPDKTKVLFV